MVNPGFSGADGSNQIQLLPFEQTCAALDVAPATLRRWINQGAPQAKRGRKGRGGQALFDLEAIAAWRRQEGGGDALKALAGELPEIVAAAVYEAFKLADGPHKRPSADVLAGTWYLVTTAILNRIGDDAPVRGVTVMPERIEHLRRIADGKFIDPRRAFFDWTTFPGFRFSMLPLTKSTSYESLNDSSSYSKYELDPPEGS